MFVEFFMRHKSEKKNQQTKNKDHITAGSLALKCIPNTRQMEQTQNISTRCRYRYIQIIIFTLSHSLTLSILFSN